MGNRRISLRQLAVAVVSASVVLIAALAWEIRGKIHDGYAAWNATHAMGAFIVRHDGSYPASWADLVDSDPNFGRRRIAKLQKRVAIDFDAKPPRIEIISGRQPAWNRPNEEIAQLVREFELPLSERKSIYWYANYHQEGSYVDRHLENAESREGDRATP